MKKTWECKIPEGDVYFKDDCGNWAGLKEDCVDCQCAGGACQYVLYDHIEYILDCVVWTDCKGMDVPGGDYCCTNYQFSNCGCKYLDFPGGDAQLYHGNTPAATAGTCADISIPGWHDGNQADGYNIRWTWTSLTAVPPATNPIAYSGDKARWTLDVPQDAYYNVRVSVPGTKDLCNSNPDNRYAYDVYFGLVRMDDTGLV